jgi:hypothetical protein
MRFGVRGHVAALLSGAAVLQANVTELSVAHFANRNKEKE